MGPANENGRGRGGRVRRFRTSEDATQFHAGPSGVLSEPPRIVAISKRFRVAVLDASGRPNWLSDWTSSEEAAGRLLSWFIRENPAAIVIEALTAYRKWASSRPGGRDA